MQQEVPNNLPRNGGTPQLGSFNITPVANVALKAANMCLIEVADNNAYFWPGGLLAPGVVAFTGIIAQSKTKLHIIRFLKQTNIYI